MGLLDPVSATGDYGPGEAPNVSPGLLGAFNGWMQDPRNQQALLAFGANLMSSRSATAGTALQAAMKARQEYEDRAQMQAMQKLQFQKLGLDVNRASTINNAIQSGLQPMQGQPQGQPAPGAMQPGMAPQMGNAPQGGIGMPPGANSLPYLLALAKDDPATMQRIQQEAMTGIKRDPGATYEINGKPQYFADPSKGIDFNPLTKQVTPLSGAADALAGIQGASTLATERAKQQVSLDQPGVIPGMGRNGAPVYTTPRTMMGGQQTTYPGATPDISAALDTLDKAGLDISGIKVPANVGTRSGGVMQGADPVATKAAETFASSRATAAGDYGKALDDKVATGIDLKNRMEESRQALTQFKPGMGAEARLNVARFAQAIGAPDSLVTKINGGDVSAKQEFMKLSAQTAMESLKQAMGGSGRITQAEFKVFQANNPNIELDPNAIEKIYNFADKVHQRNFAEQQAYDKYVNVQKGDPARFPAYYAKNQMLLNPTSKASNAVKIGGYTIERAD
jgi:hypothetical protein